MLLFADPRRFSSADEGYSQCVFCERELVLLPDDRRRGACFDCLPLAVPESFGCPRCGEAIPPEHRAYGCRNCSWYPGHG